MDDKQGRISAEGTMVSTVWECDGIRLGHAVSRFAALGSFAVSSQYQDVVRLHFGLKGDYLFYHKQLNRTFDLIGSHLNLMYSREFDMVVENKTLELETFGVQFPRELFIQFTQHAGDSLGRFSEEITKGNSAILSDKWAAVNPGIEQVIRQIIHCKYNGDLKKLFLLSKSLELLVLSADACSQTTLRKEIFIKNKTDKEKIIAVRDLINERVLCPPNLSEISRTIGLNEYKLKRGFREIFDTTVFGYLAEQRLHLAQQYLRDTEKTAAEISLDLGYATPQHFNNAFKKKFGVTPASVRNTPLNAIRPYPG